MEIKPQTVILANPSWCNGCKFLDNYTDNQKPVNCRCVLGYWNQRGDIVPQMQKLSDWKIFRSAKCIEDNGQPPKGYNDKLLNDLRTNGAYTDNLEPKEISEEQKIQNTKNLIESVKKDKKKKK